MQHQPYASHAEQANSSCPCCRAGTGNLIVRISCTNCGNETIPTQLVWPMFSSGREDMHYTHSVYAPIQYAAVVTQQQHQTAPNQQTAQMSTQNIAAKKTENTDEVINEACKSCAHRERLYKEPPQYKPRK